MSKTCFHRRLFSLSPLHPACALGFLGIAECAICAPYFLLLCAAISRKPEISRKPMIQHARAFLIETQKRGPREGSREAPTNVQLSQNASRLIALMFGNKPSSGIGFDLMRSVSRSLEYFFFVFIISFETLS